ncbi:MAG: hypothetical protein H6828_08795 [Planctomycetes bacterium]|nr:hypothetical protein [Planctomycetota bacterium]
MKDDDSKRLTPQAQLQALVGKFDPGAQRLFRSLRTALRKRFPTANELVYDYAQQLVVSYSPSENGIDAVAALALRADGARLYVHGARLPDPQKLLQGSGKQARYVPLETAARLRHPDVEALLAAAVAQAQVPLATSGKGRLVVKSSATKGRSGRGRSG